MPGAPDAATRSRPGVFPATDSRRPRRAGAGPVGLQARWPSPGPSWPWDPPGLHGRPTGWCRRPSQESDTLPSCASHARRDRLAPSSSSSSSFQPDLRIAPCVPPCRACLVASLKVTLQAAHQAAPLAGRTMSHSSFQRSPLHCLGSRGVHVPRARRRDRFGDRSPTRLVRRLRGLAPPWRFTPPRPCPGVAPGFQSWGS